MAEVEHDVVVERDGTIATVRLNRPDRGNSVTPGVVTRMGDLVEELTRTDGIDAVVLTGTGKVFCAGADVNEMHVVYKASGIDGLCDYLADTWMPAVQRTVRKIWSADRPVVAAFNGAATAGGLDFGLACDARIASTAAKFGESYVNLGMVPVAGGAYLLPLAVGLPAALELLASGDIIDAARASEIGMVNELSSPEDLASRAHELASRLSRGTSETVREIRRIARLSATPQFDAVLRESYDADVRLIARDDVRANIVTVMERYADATGSHR